MCMFWVHLINPNQAVQCELNDYLLLDLQGVHVVIALGGVLLRMGLGINEHIVFVP